MKLSESRALLNAAVQATPALPNLNSRLGVHVHCELVDGRPKCKGSRYIVNILDRAPLWILPRYAKSYASTSLSTVTSDAATWIEDRTAELHAMSARVNAAIVTMQPFHA